MGLGPNPANTKKSDGSFSNGLPDFL